MIVDEEGCAEGWSASSWRWVCWFGRHDWYHLEHFPNGDSFPPGYIARRCKRCGKVQWNTLPAVILPSPGWVNGWPRRAKPHFPAAIGPQPEVTVLHPIEPGLTKEEQGLP